MTHPRFLAALAALGFLTACSSDGTTTPNGGGEDAATAASRFDHVADSVSAASGVDAAAPYRAMADVVRQAGAVSSVTLHIGSEDVPFSAVGVSTVISGNVPCAIPPVALGTPDGKTTPAFCPLAFPVATRTLLAWQAGKPARLLQLLATAEKSSVGYNPLAMVPLPAGTLAFPATLTYNDGGKGFWWATTGNQANSMTLGTACPPATSADGGKRSTTTTTKCTEARFTWDFSAGIAPFPLPIAGNTASGTKTISMGNSTVNGVQLEITISPPPAPAPNPLKSSLGTKLDGGSLAMTFTVTNAADSAVTLTFPTSQQYDFWIVDKTTGREIWRWSTGKGFAQVVATKTLAAKGSLSFTESWTPTVHGTVAAHAVLRARPDVSADAAVTLP